MVRAALPDIAHQRMNHPYFSDRILREPLREALRTRQRIAAPAGGGHAAAVLIAMFERDDDVHLWMLRRPTGMRMHSGQVAFPGGKRDPEDDSLLTTALREAHEEIGLAPASIDVLGALDDRVTSTGYTVTPYAAWVAGDAVLTPSPHEVARVFAVPLRRFVDAAPLISRFSGYRIDGEFVWGATAAMARGLGVIVRGILKSA